MMVFREPNQARWIGTRPAFDGDQVCKYITANNAIAIVYTVPHGHTFFLCGFVVTINGGAVNDSVELEDRDAGDVVARTYVKMQLSAVGQEVASHSFWPPIEIPEDYDIILVSNTVTSVGRGTIHGWLT
jgi:hypothetical protein